MPDSFDHEALTRAEGGWPSILSPGARRRIIDACSLRDVAKGEVLWQFGDDVDGLYFILSGCFRTETVRAKHGPAMLIIFHSGSWIGEAEILAGTARITTMAALRDSSCLFLPLSRALAIAEQYPDVWRGLGYLAAEHLYLAVAGMSDLMIRSSEDRLAAILLRICGARLREFPGTINTDLDVTQTELGELCNLSRSVISTLLDDFEKRGLVRMRYGRVEILDVRSLAAMISVEIAERAD